MRLNLLHEHPTWSVSLLRRFEERGLNVLALDVGTMIPSVPVPNAGSTIDLWVNRVNAMPSTGRSASVVAATSHFLLALETAGQPVFNGYRSFALGGSKAAQAALFAEAGAAAPAAVLIAQPSQALAAAEEIGYPVLTKPNIGGSGAGIARYDDADTLRQAVESDLVDLGVDGTGLVQQVIPSADGLVHRIEMLGRNVFYATDQPVLADAFNYCAVDGCASGEDAIELVDPDPGMVQVATAVMTRAGADIGGIEYLISAEDGRPYVYDFNPYSNFIEGREGELGFDPLDRYIDAVMAKAAPD